MRMSARVHEGVHGFVGAQLCQCASAQVRACVFMRMTRRAASCSKSKILTCDISTLTCPTEIGYLGRAKLVLLKF